MLQCVLDAAGGFLRQQNVGICTQRGGLESLLGKRHPSSAIVGIPSVPHDLLGRLELTGFSWLSKLGQDRLHGSKVQRETIAGSRVVLLFLGETLGHGPTSFSRHNTICCAIESHFQSNCNRSDIRWRDSHSFRDPVRSENVGTRNGHSGRWRRECPLPPNSERTEETR